jgi:hypothetical protein
MDGEIPDALPVRYFLDIGWLNFIGAELDAETMPDVLPGGGASGQWSFRENRLTAELGLAYGPVQEVKLEAAGRKITQVEISSPLPKPDAQGE